MPRRRRKKTAEARELANALIDYGKDNHMPEAIVIGTKILAANPPEILVARGEGGQQAASDKLHEEQKQLAKLLNQATKMAIEDAAADVGHSTVAALVKNVRRASETSEDATLIPGQVTDNSWQATLDPGEKYPIIKECVANCEMIATVEAMNDPDAMVAIGSCVHGQKLDPRQLKAAKRIVSIHFTPGVRSTSWCTTVWNRSETYCLDVEIRTRRA